MPRIPEMDTSRLRLRRQAIEDAPVFRHLWTERDERVPPHRRLDPDGRPDVDDIRAHIRDAEESSLLTVERIDTGDPIGYCGLVYGGEGVGTEPELAFELLRAEHNRGHATEAAQAVLTWADGAGFDRVWPASGNGTSRPGGCSRSSASSSPDGNARPPPTVEIS